MRITCEFNNLEELKHFANQIQISGFKAPQEEIKEALEKGNLPLPDAKDFNQMAEEKEERERVQTEEAGEKTEIFTLVDVRAKLADLQKSGKREGVKNLLKSFGAAKLSDVPEDKYGELMKKAGEL